FAGAFAFSAVAFASEDSAVFEGKDRLHCNSWEWILSILAGEAESVSRKLRLIVSYFVFHHGVTEPRSKP
ncbi:MAG: hypothetical protein ACLQEI_17080, partial [Terriglobales bacterium]